MGKNLNPADAYRKAQRKKELKKNKAERSKTRDFALVKKDTTELEDVIKELEASREDPGKLAELKAELEKINKKKAEYVEQHPEMRRMVYRRRKAGEPEPELPVQKTRNLFNKNGLPRHPERSIYYDPVMNPFGVAPPGMPYIERPLLPNEVDSQDEGDNDDDIPLPPGLPPGSEEVTSDDDIPMPDGPPPGQEALYAGGPPPISPTPKFTPPPPGPPAQAVPFIPTPPPHLVNINPPIPPPPPGFAASTMHLPPPPPGPPPNMMPLGNWAGQPYALPPPPLGYPPNMPNFQQSPPGMHPQPPPGFFPRRQQGSSSMQDPLSSIPHQTFQAHRANQLANASAPPQSKASTLPVNPSLPAKPVAAAEMAAATVSAAPQLRDFKKEATAFVPTAVKRRKPGDSSSKLDAAPSVESPPDAEQEIGPARPSLLDSLKDQFGPIPPKKAKVATSDYDKFVEEMGDILG